MRCLDLLRKFDPRLSAGGGALRPRAAGLAVQLLLRAVHAVRDSVTDDANAIAEQKRDDRPEYLGFPLAAAEERVGMANRRADQFTTVFVSS